MAEREDPEAGPGDAGRAEPDGWARHEAEQRAAWRRTTPRQRLAWLEDAKRFALRARDARVGTDEAPREDDESRKRP